MNDTKWRELVEAVQTELPFEPFSVARYLRNPDDIPLGDFLHWEHLNVATEWVKVHTRTEVHRGMLVPPAIIECTDQFRSILERLNIPYSEDNGIFTVYGHSKGVVFDNKGAATP
jgi:hypothetical protein